MSINLHQAALSVNGFAPKLEEAKACYYNGDWMKVYDLFHELVNDTNPQVVAEIKVIYANIRRKGSKDFSQDLDEALELYEEVIKTQGVSQSILEKAKKARQKTVEAMHTLVGINALQPNQKIENLPLHLFLAYQEEDFFTSLNYYRQVLNTILNRDLESSIEEGLNSIEALSLSHEELLEKFPEAELLLVTLKEIASLFEQLEEGYYKYWTDTISEFIKKYPDQNESLDLPDILLKLIEKQTNIPYAPDSTYSLDMDIVDNNLLTIEKILSDETLGKRTIAKAYQLKGTILRYSNKIQKTTGSSEEASLEAYLKACLYDYDLQWEIISAIDRDYSRVDVLTMYFKLIDEQKDKFEQIYPWLDRYGAPADFFISFMQSLEHNSINETLFSKFKAIFIQAVKNHVDMNIEAGLKDRLLLLIKSCATHPNSAELDIWLEEMGSKAHILSLEIFEIPERYKDALDSTKIKEANEAYIKWKNHYIQTFNQLCTLIAEESETSDSTLSQAILRYKISSSSVQKRKGGKLSPENGRKKQKN